MSSLTNTPQSYIMFTATQYDNYSYLFQRPTFISLNSSWTPTAPIAIQGIRLGENGQEIPVDQAYIPLNVSVDAKDYTAGKGQLLSPLGTVIPLENGPTNDQFFLTFAQIGTSTHSYSDPTPTAPTPTDLPPSSDIGLRVWDELNATMAKTTGVSTNAAGPSTTYQTVQQALPNVYDLQSVTSANLIGGAQLAMQYCEALVQDPTLAPAFFPGMNFNSAPGAAFGSSGGMDLIATPLIVNLVGQNVAAGLTIGTQPTDPVVRQELYSLITGLAADPSATTPTITMAVCTAILTSATSLLK